MTEEQILLTQLAEECNEVAQRCSKAIRFGLDEQHHSHTMNNAEMIVDELNDLMGVALILQNRGLIPSINPGKVLAKKDKVDKYLDYSRQLGILN